MKKRIFFENNSLNFILSICCSIIKAFLQVIFAVWVQRLFDLSIQENLQDLFDLVILLIIYFILILINGYILKEVKNRFVGQAMYVYKRFIFENICSKKINDFNQRETTEYLSLIVNDSLSIEKNYLEGFMEIIYNISLLIMALIMMIKYNFLMFVIGFVCSMIPIFVSSILGRKLIKLEKEVSDSNDLFLKKAKNILDGFTVFKSFKAEKEVLKIFDKENRNLEKIKVERKKTNDMINVLIYNIANISHMILFVSGVYLTISGYLTTGVLIAFVQLMNYVLNPIEDLSIFYANFKSVSDLIKKMESLIVKKNEDVHKIDIETMGDDIILKNLGFSYGEKNILNNIDFKFEFGKSYALIGGSGSGKSTLLNLITGNLVGYTGNIYINKLDLKEISQESIYDILSIIEQNVFVFNSSIKDNITMFKKFDQSLIDEVVKKAGLKSLIDKHGFDYICGENGKNLSGGEKQRISIARALLKKSQILLMDEATSALDVQTTMDIENTILNLQDVLKIVVTHKMNATILQKYDSIIVLSHGQLVEVGNYDELMNKRGYFYSLYLLNQ